MTQSRPNPRVKNSVHYLFDIQYSVVHNSHSNSIRPCSRVGGCGAASLRSALTAASAWKTGARRVAVVTDERLTLSEGRKTQGIVSVVERGGVGAGSKVRKSLRKRGLLWSTPP